jgi:hypothetical protein
MLGPAVVRVASNPLTALEHWYASQLNSLAEIGFVIEKAVIAANIKLHPSRKMQKYLPEA